MPVESCAQLVENSVESVGGRPFGLCVTGDRLCGNCVQPGDRLRTTGDEQGTSRPAVEIHRSWAQRFPQHPHRPVRPLSCENTGCPQYPPALLIRRTRSFFREHIHKKLGLGTTPHDRNRIAIREFVTYGRLPAAIPGPAASLEPTPAMLERLTGCGRHDNGRVCERVRRPLAASRRDSCLSQRNRRDRSLWSRGRTVQKGES